MEAKHFKRISTLVKYVLDKRKAPDWVIIDSVWELELMEGYIKNIGHGTEYEFRYESCQGISLKISASPSYTSITIIDESE